MLILGETCQKTIQSLNSSLGHLNGLFDRPMLYTYSTKHRSNDSQELNRKAHICLDTLRVPADAPARGRDKPAHSSYRDRQTAGRDPLQSTQIAKHM